MASIEVSARNASLRWNTCFFHNIWWRKIILDYIIKLKSSPIWINSGLWKILIRYQNTWFKRLAINRYISSLEGLYSDRPYESSFTLVRRGYWKYLNLAGIDRTEPYYQHSKEFSIKSSKRRIVLPKGNCECLWTTILWVSKLYDRLL